jgi:hypothetical protein
MKAQLAVVMFLVGALFGAVSIGASVAARIDGGQSTLSWEIEPGATRISRAHGPDGGVAENVRVSQAASVCVAGREQCRQREIVCTSGTTATLDGRPIPGGSMPAALTAFCGALLGTAPNFVTRRDAMFNAAGMKTLLVGQ